MPKLSLRLSEDARAGWDKTTVRYGVTLTALIEACGIVLNARPGMVTDETRPGIVQPDVIDLARRLDADRRSRR